MIRFNKFFERISRLFNFMISNNHKLNHKYQNKNQVTNTEIILNLLKNKNFKPKIIVDIGCGYGQWTKKIIKYYPNADYFLFDADINNLHKLESLKKKYNNLQFKICLLSNDNANYTFYNMGYGSSIFEEQTNHKRLIQEIKSTTLIQELPSIIKNHSNNLIKLDVQGAELKVLDGLKEYINFFEIIILEVSLHNYNKEAPLFNEIMTYMDNKNYKLYDIFDLKRLGEINSFLIQFDCVFVKKDSNLFNVKF
ncbi:FkbM family methyltransferase [Candidatus Pelagibacter sp. HIMB1748]|uniref:FkbM family methyltransferase n=2 Tax=Candidatus Pelagibacter TaxID=198251 RepID=UPI003F8729E4